MNKFVSETEIEEKKKKRQEEWEKVRNADDPKEAPEVPYDPRSLFDQLQEQKDKKQNDFEESIKFKNQFRGINKTESDFLNQVATQASLLEKQKRDEEKRELDEFRKAAMVVKLIDPPADNNVPLSEKEVKLSNAQPAKRKSNSSQLKLIQKCVKRKSDTVSEIKNNKKALLNQDASANNNKPDNTVSEKAKVVPNSLLGLSSYASDSESENEDT